MRALDQIPAPLLALAAGTILSGATIAALAIALSLLLTGNFLFEGPVHPNIGAEAVTPYFGAVAIAILGTAALLTLELGAWCWLRRRT